MFITTSQTVVGQTLFKLLDSFLWVIEKSAQWSLPAQEIEAGMFELFYELLQSTLLL